MNRTKIEKTKIRHNKMLNFGIAILCVFTIAACTTQKTESEAVSYAATLKSNEAEIFLKNYLNSNAEASQARLLLAEMMVKQGDYENALFQYTRISGPLSAEAQTFKIEALYLTNRFDEIIELFENQGYPEGRIDTATLIYALLSQQVNNELEPLNTLAKAAEQSTDNTPLVNVIQVISDYTSHLDNTLFSDSLYQLYQQDVSLKTNWLFLSLLGNAAFSNQDYDIAAQVFDDYDRLRPKFEKIKLLKASALVYGKRWNEAKEILSDLLRGFPDQPLVNYLYAYVAASEKDYEQAKLSMESAIQNGYDTRKNLLFAGEVNFRLQKYEQAISFLERGLVGVSTANNFYDMLLYSKAVTGTADIIVQDLNRIEIDSASDLDSINSMLSGMQKANDALSLSDLLDKLTIDPELDSADVFEFSLAASGLGKQQFSPLRITASKSLLERYFAGEDTFEQSLISNAKTALISDLISQQKYQEAISLSDEWSSKIADNFNVLLKAEVLNLQKQYSNTVALLEPLLNEFDNGPFYNALGAAYYNTNNKQEALAVVKKGLSKYPFNLTLLRQYGSIAVDLKLNEDAYVNNLYNGNTLQDALSLSIFYGIKSEFEKARAVLQAVPKSEQNSFVYWYTLAEVYLKLNDKSNALSSLNNVERFNLLSVQQIESALNTFERLDNLPAQINLLKKHIQNYPNNSDLKLMLVDVLLRSQEAREAEKLLSTFEAESEQYWLLSAKTALSVGNLIDAESFYKRAQARYSSDKSVVEYAQFMALTDRTNEAIDMLQAHTESNPLALNPLLLLATLQQGDSAIAQYKKVLAMSPNNVVALNNIAYQYQLLGNYDLALPYAEKAVQLSPENASIQETLESIKQNL